MSPLVEEEEYDRARAVEAEEYDREVEGEEDDRVGRGGERRSETSTSSQKRGARTRSRRQIRNEGHFIE